jgi:hypothetical protein
MKRIAWIVLGWLALLATAQADQQTANQERQKTHIVSRMYQATYGAQKQCSSHKDELARLDKIIDKFRHTYPELMRLVESSPYLPQAKEELKAWGMLDRQLSTQDCLETENMLHQWLENPEGEKVANDMIQTLKGNGQSQSVATVAAWPPDSFGPKLPLIIHWNVVKNGSLATEEFIVTEYRSYNFNLVFRYSERQRSVEDFKKLEQFTGNGSYHRVTKESAGTAHPVDVPEFSQQEQDFLKNGGSFVGGTYFNDHPLGSNQRIHEPPPNTVFELTKDGAGVIIPIYIKIELVDDRGGTKILTENVFDTKGITGSGSYGLERTITNVGLHPGKYLISVKTTKETAIPEGVETLLRVTWDPRFGILKDTK